MRQNRVVREYRVPAPSTDVSLTMPRGATVIGADFDRDNPILWALVDPTCDEMEQRKFILLETDEPVSMSAGVSLVHHGSFRINDQSFHLFEIVTQEVKPTDQRLSENKGNQSLWTSDLRKDANQSLSSG